MHRQETQKDDGDRETDDDDLVDDALLCVFFRFGHSSRSNQTLIGTGMSAVSVRRAYIYWHAIDCLFAVIYLGLRIQCLLSTNYLGANMSYFYLVDNKTDTIQR